MSMLAEPRRKQKWSVDPRNSAWSNDESKFGQKMLERMGWSKGKGLGKSEQGATEHIKVKVKNNSLGLGTTVSNEDNWIAHQDDFNQLLAELNNCHGQNNTEEATEEQTQGFSLEEKSKTSRKRVHYMKFTKGKDLSNRSETDLACIFGKRSKQARDQDETSSDSSSPEEKEQDSNGKDRPSNPEPELNTVTSTLTMQEYFAQRMAQLKKGQSAAYSPAASSNPQSPTISASTEDSPNTSDVEQRKKKKKKKRKQDGQEDEEKVREAEEPPLIDKAVDTELGDSERRKKKKKNKKKREAGEEDTAEECSVLTAVDDADGDMSAFSRDKKKKKQKDKDAPTCTPTDSASEHHNTEKVMDTEVSSKKKKKRKRSEQFNEPVVAVEEKKPKKDKKKKKTDD